MTSAQKFRTARVFIDSSVFFAASLSASGNARRLVLLGIRSTLKLYVSPLVWEETERNLVRKAPEAVPVFQLWRDILPAHLVSPTKSLVLRVGEAIPLKDAPIVAGAIEAQAQYLATYDQKHLLSQRDRIKANFGIIAATPDEILTRISTPGASPYRPL